MSSYYEKEEEFTDYDLMPPEDQRHARVPKGKKYPERRAGIINTKAFGFHPDEFKLALNSMRKGGKRLGSVFGYPNSNKGLKRKGPREGLSLWDRLNETRNNIKRPDDVVNCYISGVETKERRITYSPQHLEEKFVGKEKQQYDSRTQKEKDESIAQIVKETMKAEKSTSSNDASSSASSNDTPNDTPNDVLSEFGDWAERMSINSDDVATTFDSSDSVTIVDVMDMYGQHVCEGCGLKDRPANWQGLCQACTDGGYKTTI